MCARCGDTVEASRCAARAGARANDTARAEVRVDAPCPHYGVCGGCSFQHVEVTAQIQIKQELLSEQFKRIGKVETPELWSPLVGEHWGYRRKARMGVKYVEK